MVCDGKIHPLGFLFYSSKPEVKFNSLYYAPAIPFTFQSFMLFQIYPCAVGLLLVAQFQLMVHSFPKVVVFEGGWRERR